MDDLAQAQTDSTVALPINAKVEQRVHALKSLTDKDADRLATAFGTRGEYLSHGQWEKLLGFESRQGAYDFLVRMQREGFAILEKHPEGGTNVRPTTEGLVVLKSLNKIK